MPITNSHSPCMDQYKEKLAEKPYSMQSPAVFIQRLHSLSYRGCRRSLWAFTHCLWGTCEHETIALSKRNGICTVDPSSLLLRYSQRRPLWPVCGLQCIWNLFSPAFFHMSAAKNSVFSQKQKTMKWAFREMLAMSGTPGQTACPGQFRVPDPGLVM